MVKSRYSEKGHKILNIWNLCPDLGNWNLVIRSRSVNFLMNWGHWGCSFEKIFFGGRIMKSSSWILAPFLSEAVEANQCYFFENWLMKHKWATLVNMPCEHASRDILSKFSLLLPLRAIYFRSYQYETPCIFLSDVLFW